MDYCDHGLKCVEYSDVKINGQNTNCLSNIYYIRILIHIIRDIELLANEKPNNLKENIDIYLRTLMGKGIFKSLECSVIGTECAINCVFINSNENIALGFNL